MSFSFKMAPTRSILGFLNPKTITAVISSNISKTPCRFVHKCSNYCDYHLGAATRSGAVLSRKDFRRKFYMLSLHHPSVFFRIEQFCQHLYSFTSLLCRYHVLTLVLFRVT